MREEIVQSLIGERDLLFLDCTLGEGGHSEAILERYPNIKVLGFDRDGEILDVARERLSKYNDRFVSINKNFKDIDLKNDLNGQKVDGALIDLGISVFHYKSSNRGFSFSQKERLDMRLDDSATSVFDIVNSYSYEDLVKIFFEYGEERFSREIVKNIIKERTKNKIEWSDDLASIILEAIPLKYRFGKIHPATKVFQSLRIEANKELENIKIGLPKIVSLLKDRAKLGVITFHSVEDRIVKNIFKYLSLECVCPPKFPKCVCNKKKEINIIGKPIIPTGSEIGNNPPSRSAKLRIVERFYE